MCSMFRLIWKHASSKLYCLSSISVFLALYTAYFKLLMKKKKKNLFLLQFCGKTTCLFLAFKTKIIIIMHVYYEYFQSTWTATIISHRCCFKFTLIWKAVNISKTKWEQKYSSYVLFFLYKWVLLFLRPNIEHLNALKII